MAIDLKTHEKAMLAAFEDVVGDKSDNDWWGKSLSLLLAFAVDIDGLVWNWLHP